MKEETRRGLLVWCQEEQQEGAVVVFTPTTFFFHTGSCHTLEKQILEERGVIRFMEIELSQLPSTLGVEESWGGGPALSTELDPKAPISPKRCMCY